MLVEDKWHRIKESAIWECAQKYENPHLQSGREEKIYCRNRV